MRFGNMLHRPVALTTFLRPNGRLLFIYNHGINFGPDWSIYTGGRGYWPPAFGTNTFDFK